MTAFRRTQLIRLGVWIGLATVAVLTTVLAARTETGVRRIATLLTPPAAERAAKAPVQVATHTGRRAAASDRSGAWACGGPRPADGAHQHARAQSRRCDRVDPARGRKPETASPLRRTWPRPSRQFRPLRTPTVATSTQYRVAAGHLATGVPTASRIRRRPEPNSASMSAATRRSRACGRLDRAQERASPRCSKACGRSLRSVRARSRARSSYGWSRGRSPTPALRRGSAPRSPRPARPASRPCSTGNGWRCSKPYPGSAVSTSRAQKDAPSGIRRR